MSPRRTKAFHHLCHFEHLGPVFLVGFEGADLRGQFASALETGRRFDEGGSDSL